MSTIGFADATRVATNPLAGLERRCLVWMAGRLPRWITSDGLTALALAAMAFTGLCYAYAPGRPGLLLLAIVGLALNWFGDSLDGTLARVRQPAAAALRLLRRSHRRLLRRALCRGRPRLVRLYDTVRRDGPSHRVFHALDRNLPGDLLSGGVPALLLGRRSDRAPPAARGRNRRPPVRSESRRFWVSTIGCSMWAGRSRRSASPSRSSLSVMRNTRLLYQAEPLP